MKKKYVVIVLEYGKCSMHDLLEAKRVYKEGEILSIMAPICDALYVAYAKKKIAHRDIKP